MIEGDTRFGTLAGGPGWLLFDNPGFEFYKHPWRKLRSSETVRTWTDGYADVTGVMRMDEIRWIRKLLGLPVLADD